MLGPAEVINELTLARDAAKRYVDTHAGFKNLFSGWSQDGRKRIEEAQNAYDILDE